MSQHNAAKHLFGSLAPAADPGASGTITVDRTPHVVPLVSAAAETRTLGRPTREGAIVFLYMRTDGGDITLTVTGGFNEDGDTSFTFSDAGQFILLMAAYDGSSYYWRKVSDYSTGVLTPTEMAYLQNITAGTTEPSKAVVTGSSGQLIMAAATTPTAVATSPATAAPTELTATGGVGGGTTIATTGVGGVGGGFALTGGAGGTASAAATAATGGAGGALSVTMGAGGAEAVAGVDSTGGAGGAVSLTSGAGGAVSAAVSGTATGGASGAVTLATGTGGAVTATTGTNVGGASGAVSLVSGTGGAASGATDTGGASGAVTVGSGTGGAGDTGGASGVVTIKTGAAGAGGSPAIGHIAFSPGAAEKWRITDVGILTSVAGAPANAPTTDGGILATGGFAITDVANAWIDDATQGSGTTTHYIGNQAITTSSDIRIKKDIVNWNGSAMAALAKAPRLVEYTYDMPGGGGDRAEDNDNARRYGPNARGRYLGWLAQETVEVFPWAVNAGAGKECPKCSKGETCDNPEHSFWHVEYQHLVPLMVKALQEANVRIKKLEAKVSAQG